MDCSLLGFSVDEISQARILEWVAISFSGISFQPMDQTRVSYTGRQIPYHWAAWEALFYHLHSILFFFWDPVNFVGSTVSKLPITCVEARMGAVVSLAWVHPTIFLTSLRFICFISKNTCYKAQVTRLLWRLHNMMLLAQSWREWSSLNICSLFVITLPESELVWRWWLRLVPFNGTPLQYSCLENPWMEEPGGL